MNLPVVDISFIGFSELLEKLSGLPEAVDSGFAAAAQSLMDGLRQKVQDDELSGQALAVRSGALKAGIEDAVEASPGMTSGSVFVAGDVPYAAILEYGGVTKAHIIEAGKARALAFVLQGKQAFFRRVEHPGSDIPPHPYLEPAFDDMQDGIVDGFAAALAQVAGA